MIELSTFLGNSKTPILQEVEKAIWKTLFSLASGTLDSRRLLNQLVDDLPWDQIQRAGSDESERTWFSLGKSIVLLYLSTSRILCIV
jgi:hypothetical protein